jgi:septal ring factor EnvC (AmiA/AmiB activator)
MRVRLAMTVGLLALAGAALAQDRAAEPRHRVADARKTLAELNDREAELAQKIGDNRGQLARLLGALQLFGRDPPPALLVNPRDAKAAVRAAILIRAITPELEARAQALAADAGELAKARRLAAEANGDLFAAESALSDRKSRLDGVMADAESNLLAGPARPFTNSLASQPTPTHLLAPVESPVTTRYGGRLADGARASGVAYRPSPGTAVVSPASGVADYVGPLNGWGFVVILRGGGGSHMVLSGLGKVSIATGQSVAAGQVVGAMSADGQSPPELYFEVRMRGKPVDPARLISGTAQKTQTATAD